MDVLEVKQKNKYYEKIIKEVQMDGNLAMANHIVDAKEHDFEPKENADNILFRSSANGYLMVEPRSKSETLPESTKTHLIDIFISEHYKRKEDLVNKFLNKGNECEEDGITLLSRVSKVLYKKNEVHLSNDFIKGTPDLFIGESIHNADETIDTKLSWSAHTFFRAQKDELNKMYYWQGQSYMWLAGAKKHTVAYCLVNGTETAITDEKRKLSFRKGMMDFNGNESPEFVDKCKQIEINHIFDLELFKKHNPFFQFHSDTENWSFDIPKEERVFQITFDRNDADIERLKKRVIDCRQWMNGNLYKL